MGRWGPERGTNFLDSGCFYYDVYRTSDDRYMAVGALEEKFFTALVGALGFTTADFPGREDPTHWDAYRAKLASVFATRTQAQWTRVFAATDACVAPVLTMPEATTHPHAHARQAFIQLAGITQPAPAPRFSRTPSAVRGPPPVSGEHTRSVLLESGFSAADIERLVQAGAIALAP
jgi:alpha-methylacyl-CoA racemase